jgi:hypothetical protein
MTRVHKVHELRVKGTSRGARIKSPTLVYTRKVTSGEIGLKGGITPRSRECTDTKTMQDLHYPWRITQSRWSGPNCFVSFSGITRIASWK